MPHIGFIASDREVIRQILDDETEQVISEEVIAVCKTSSDAVAMVVDLLLSEVPR